jgi:leader peptidase (prepilin peptidase)/N-methyltransferase
MINIIVIVIGLIIGSFLNVIIYRLPRKESILWPGSHCPACGQDLKAWELIPLVSYFLLGGRCRYCGQRIKLRYPLVEVLTPVSFGLVFLKTGISIETGLGWTFSALLITVACTDVEEGMIPNLITYPGILIGLSLAFTTIGLSSAVLGLLLFGGVYLGAALLSDGGMGGGDIKLAGAIGAFLGPGGAAMTLVLSSLTGGLWAAFLLGQGKANRKTAIKFGPFLAGAAWLVWMYRGEIIDLYMGLFT